MANVASNVTTGKPNISGAIYRAPKTATVPTDATTPLGSDFVCLGYVSEDGLTNNTEMDVSEIKAWGGSIVYRSLTEMQDTFGCTLIESENVDVLKSVYGESNVTESEGKININVVASEPDESIWVFELSLRGGKVKRIVIPSGAITTRDEISYNDSDAVGYGITISAYPDGNGVTHKEYIA